MQSRIFRNLLALSLLCISILDVRDAGVLAESPKKLSYKLFGPAQKIRFGGPIDTPYILDTFDVNGDGADDFAVSAKTWVTNRKDYLKNKFIHSSLVLNNPVKSTFKILDLGEAGMTQRTWAGKFYRMAQNQSVYYVLGRNGEMGLPHTLKGEKTSIFEIKSDGNETSASAVYVSNALNTIASVDVCDIDSDGTEEIYVNNVLSPFGRGNRAFTTPHMIKFDGQNFIDGRPHGWMRKVDTEGAHNYIAFDDVNGDGHCDMMAAFEVFKRGDANTAYQNVNATAATMSYVVLNEDGILIGQRIDLPNPYFGKDNSAFSIALTKAGGETLVALDSSQFRGNHFDFRKFALQMFSLRGDTLVEVTDEKIVGKIDSDLASQSFVRVFDIDGDGDDDIYLTRYGRGVQIYLYHEGKYLLQRLALGLPDGQKAVAFLKNPNSRCADIAVLDRNARLFRFRCVLK